MTEVRSAIVIFFSLFSGFNSVYCQYEVPPALVEPLVPRGLRVSIPDHDGITLFAFHGNINKDFENGREAGEMAVDVLRKKNGRWTYTNRDRSLKKGDVIYYWLYVIKDKLGYERLFQSHTVTEFFKEEGGAPQPGPPEPPTPGPTVPPQIPQTPQTTQTPDQGSKIPQECSKPSVTTVNGINQCSGQLIFDSSFSNGIDQKWLQNVYFGDAESEFVVFDNWPENAKVTSGILSIIPTTLDSKYTEGFTLRGPLNLGKRCTTREKRCSMEHVSTWQILPPVLSARLTTENTFSFRYGTVEVKAKLPHGDWVVPELWLQPKVPRYGWESSGRMVLAKSLGNTVLTSQNIELGNNVFTAGLLVNNKTRIYKNEKSSGLWSDEFHTFKLQWNENKITFFLDSQEIISWNGEPPLLQGHNILSPFDEEFYLILGVHAGGPEDFPDDAINSGVPKPWKNSHPKKAALFYEDSTNWKRTWGDRTKLQVEYVKVWAL